MSSVATTASRWEAQRSFDELGRPLRDVTFCVVDLETTGGSAAGGSMITEIGAVKVRGGEVLGEFRASGFLPSFLNDFLVMGLVGPGGVHAVDAV